MKYLRIALFILLLIILATPLVALASDISGALYWAQILVSNNGTAATNVVTTVSYSLNTTNLINGGFLNAGANNSAMRSSSGADLPFMPGYTPDGNPWCVWVPAIGANSYLTDILYTANSSGGEMRYFPDDAGMDTFEFAGLEPADNFTYEAQGFIDTSVSGNITGKNGGLSLVTDGSGNVTACVDNFLPSSSFDVTGAWGVQEYLAYDRDITTGITYTAPGVDGELTLYPIRGYALGVRFYAAEVGVGNNIVDAIEVHYDGAWHTIMSNYTFPENQWNYIYMPEAQAVTSANITFNAGAGGDIALYEFQFLRALSADGVSTGEHTVTLDVGQPIAPKLHFDSTLGSQVNAGALNNTSNDYWVSFSFMLDANHTAGTATAYLLGQRDAATDYIYLRLDTVAGDMIFGHREGGGVVRLLNSTITTWIGGFWYHVYASLSTVDGMRLIINDGTPDTLPAGIEAISLTTAYWIGSYPAASTSGTIGYIKDWATGTDNSTLLEITNLSHGMLPGDEINFWLIDEGTGNSIIDYGSSPQNATAGAPTSWNTTGTRPNYATLEIDGTIEDGWIFGEAIPDNHDNWLSFTNNAVPYVEYQDIYIDGVQRQYVEWEYSDNFTDQSGNNHWAAPSFRTASSDPDISANMTSFLPIMEAEAPDYVLGIAPPFISESALTGNITAPFTVVPPAGTFPLAGVIAAVATATATPTQLPLLWIAGFVIIAASLTVSATMRKHGSGSLIVKMITIVAVMGIFIALQNFGIDFWMLVVFLIIGIALSMASRQIGWT